MFRPKIEKMTTAVSVINFIEGAAAEPCTCFCHWNGRFDVELFGQRNRPSFETATLKMYYMAGINENSRIVINGQNYAVLHAENIERRGKYLILKVARLVGLKPLKIYRAVAVRDEVGGIYQEYPAVSGMFEGSIFPHQSDSSSESYGIDTGYAVEVYTMDLAGIKEMDRFGADEPDYEVKLIEDWGHYKKIIAERVSDGAS